MLILFPNENHHLVPCHAIVTEDFLITIPCHPDMIDNGVVIYHGSETTNKNNNTSLTEQLVDELIKSDLQVLDSDNHPIKINYSRLVGELIGHHLQVWKSASISLSSLLKDAAVLLSELFISDMPAKNLFEILEIDTMYKFKNNLIIPLLNSGHIEIIIWALKLIR